MQNEEGIESIFTDTFNSIVKTAGFVSDDFLAGTLLRESRKLLVEFMSFLRSGDNNGGRNDVVQYKQEQKMLLKIEVLINLLEIIRHFEFLESSNSKFLEKKLLKFKLFLMKREGMSLSTARPKSNAKSKVIAGKVLPQAEKSDKKAKSDKIKSRVIELIKNEGPIRNRDILKKIDKVSQRTIKRKISELIKQEDITREINGRVVSYRIKRF